MRFMAETGREPSTLGIEARLPYGEGDINRWVQLVSDWQSTGATHLSFNTMGAGLQHPADHLVALKKFASAIGLT
jgi:hypothetical protein